MKKIILSIILLFSIQVIAQDGSDIKYVSISDLNNSYVGKIVHLDFYNRSFGSIQLIDKNLTDKVIIDINNTEIEFEEHRVDDGFKNLFSEQYLESTEMINGYRIRIKMSKILEINSKDIKVALFLDYRDKNGKANIEKPNRIEYNFPKDILVEILVRN